MIGQIGLGESGEAPVRGNPRMPPASKSMSQYRIGGTTFGLLFQEQRIENQL